MLIEILNWRKYNPRSDVKVNHWLRINNDFLVRMFDFSADEKIIWLGLLCEASHAGKGKFGPKKELLATLLKVSPAAINAAIEKFEVAGMIKIHAYRARDADVTRTLRARDADVPLRTYERTDEIPAAVPQVQINDPPDFASSMLQKRARTPARATVSNEPTDGSRVWDAYAEAYERRYKQQPVRNKLTNSVCKQLVERLGAADAVAVVGFYLTHNKRWYVETVHNLRGCLQDAEGLVTQMRANHRVTSAEAQQADTRTQNDQAADRVLAYLESKYNPDGSPKK